MQTPFSPLFVSPTNKMLFNIKYYFGSLNLISTYFYTATILNWYHLLKIDAFKDEILGSLEWLVIRKKIIVYGFIIIPNSANGRTGTFI